MYIKESIMISWKRHGPRSITGAQLFCLQAVSLWVSYLTHQASDFFICKMDMNNNTYVLKILCRLNEIAHLNSWNSA